MSKNKINEDINQPRLIGFLKSRNDSSESSKEVFQEPIQDIEVTQETGATIITRDSSTTDPNCCNSTVNTISKRKHPSSSPDTRSSPPTKTIRNCPTISFPKMSEIDNMEKRLHDSLTKSLTESLTTSLTASLQGAKDAKLQDAIESINNTVNRMMQCSSAMNHQAANMDQIKSQVSQIQEDYEKAKVSHDAVKSKVMYLEKKSLESNLVIRGISEEKFEKESVTLEKIYSVLVRVIVVDNDVERNLAVRRIGIRRCR